MLLVPYRAEHIDQIEGARVSIPVGRLMARAMEGPHAMTAFDDEALVPVGAAGTFRIWEGRYSAWVIIGARLRGRGFRAVRLIRGYLDNQHPSGRVEAAVEHGWADAHRLVLALGFALETPAMRSFLPGERSAAMYVKVI